MSWGLATVGLALLLVAGVSQRLSNIPITTAMLVVVVGVLVGPLVFEGLMLRPTSSTVRKLAEATLAVVLFSDASRINLRLCAGKLSCRRDCSAVVCRLRLALILGVILAPTDAGLGSAVVTDARLPQRVSSFNVESGLNDGIYVPLLLIVLATSSGGAPHAAAVIGLIASFTPGALFGLLAHRDARGMTRFTEKAGSLLDATTFLVFGAPAWPSA